MAFVLEDMLAPFRVLEDHEDAVVVLDDDNAMRVLVAWSHVDNEWHEPTKPSRRPRIQPGKMAAAWSWVVAGWTIDESRVAALAGVSDAVAHRKLAMLIGNRLIYPDGSMAKGAHAALNLYTMKRLGVKRANANAAASKPKPDQGGN